MAGTWVWSCQAGTLEGKGGSESRRMVDRQWAVGSGQSDWPRCSTWTRK